MPYTKITANTRVINRLLFNNLGKVGKKTNIVLTKFYSPWDKLTAVPKKVCGTDTCITIEGASILTLYCGGDNITLVQYNAYKAEITQSRKNGSPKCVVNYKRSMLGSWKSFSIFAPFLKIMSLSYFEGLNLIEQLFNVVNQIHPMCGDIRPT